MSLQPYYLKIYTITLILLLVGFKNSYGHKTSVNSFFILGDSTVDPGNNNYIDTIPENRANHKPYGNNGFFEEPTGRFSDGRIIVDFLAEYANLPLIPPYLQPSVEYVNGVNFASAGAGVLSETNQGQAIDLKTQLKYFENVQTTLTEEMGEAEAKQLIAEAVYFISIGSNDYMGGYLGNPKMQELHPPLEYIGMVIGNLTQAIQELYERGGRKFVLLGLSPLGCLPAFRAVNAKANDKEGCFEQASALALAHNHALKSLLNNLQHSFQGFQYCSTDFYTWLLHRINDPINHGFKDTARACCGTGPYGGVFTCGGTKALKDYELCESANNHMWFDSFHPTESLHEQIAKEFWNGSAGPYNVQQLFAAGDKNVITIADVVDDPRKSFREFINV